MKKREDHQRDFTDEQVAKAKDTALSIVSTKNNNIDLSSYLNVDSLEAVEEGIRKLNDASNGAWLLSSLLLYQCVYDKSLFSQSGLDSWEDYVFNSKKRLGMSRLQVSRSLLAAKFFIEYNDKLMEHGYTPRVFQSLSFGYNAIKATGDVDGVIEHICSDSAHEFENWFRSFKEVQKLDAPNSELIRDDILIQDDGVYIAGQSLFTVSDDIPEADKVQFLKLMEQVYSAVKDGYEPAIIPVVDDNEAKTLVKLRDKDRQGR